MLRLVVLFSFEKFKLSMPTQCSEVHAELNLQLANQRSFANLRWHAYQNYSNRNWDSKNLSYHKVLSYPNSLYCLVPIILFIENLGLFTMNRPASLH